VITDEELELWAAEANVEIELVPMDGYEDIQAPRVARLISAYRELKAENEKLRKGIHDQIAHAQANGHVLDPACLGVAPGARVAAVRVAHLQAILDAS
jgi:hypothetical protein